MDTRELLIDTVAHSAPLRALEGLTDQDVEQRVPGAPHAIAEIVAHLVHWQEWFLRRAQGSGEPMAARAALGWPPPESWGALRERFAVGLEELRALDDAPGTRETKVTPPLEFPPLSQYTVADVLVHVAQHNSHHLGQIVLLRQLMGSWPPPSGGATW